MTADAPLIFGLETARPFADRVAEALGQPLGRVEERDFEAGEHKTRPLESVRERDVFVIQALNGDAQASANDKLVRLLLFVGALQDAAAGSVTAVLPYLCYARKDRKTQPRDPVSTRYVAAMVEAVGTDRVVALDVHNLAAFQNAYRISTEHLEARPLFVDHVARTLGERPLAVVSPDAGGMKRANAFRRALEARTEREVGFAIVEKYRRGGEVSGDLMVGEVEGRTAIVVDDLISSGGTLLRAAKAARDKGAVAVHAAATHGLFQDPDAAILHDPALDGVLVTDSVRLPDFARAHGDRIQVVSAVGLVAEAIRRIHTGGHLTELADFTP